jgi:hypothetical protein
VLRQILPLDEASCSAFWKEVVTPIPECVWYRQLPQGHWARRLSVRGPDWYHFFDRWPRPDPVAGFLQSQLNWEDDQLLYFVRSSRYVLQTRWCIFLDHWRSFLFSDDDPFLLAAKQPAFVLIGDAGVLAIGERPVPLALDLEGV